MAKYAQHSGEPDFSCLHMSCFFLVVQYIQVLHGRGFLWMSVSGGGRPGDAPDRPPPTQGWGVFSNNLPSDLSHSGVGRLSSQGEPGSRGTNPGKVLAPHSSFSPHLVRSLSSRGGLASSRAMQCSRVEQESRSSRRLGWDDGQTATGITE